MKERARYLGGKLKIDSEPDEGTRVELRFQYMPEQKIRDNVN
jgi:signal transduction histidine kinase